MKPRIMASKPEISITDSKIMSSSVIGMVARASDAGGAGAPV
jgi:hypothetical protein